MNITEVHIKKIIEEGSKIHCENCNGKNFKIFSSRINDEGILDSGTHEYFTTPVFVTVCNACGYADVRKDKKTLNHLS